MEACQFDAIHMNPETGLPEVDEENVQLVGLAAKLVRVRSLNSSERKEQPPRSGDVCEQG